MNIRTTEFEENILDLYFTKIQCDWCSKILPLGFNDVYMVDEKIVCYKCHYYKCCCDCDSDVNCYKRTIDIQTKCNICSCKSTEENLFTNLNQDSDEDSGDDSNEDSNTPKYWCLKCLTKKFVKI